MTWMWMWLAMSSMAPAETPDTVGRALYAAKCRSCHGDQGSGDGPAARALPKTPADLSDPALWSQKTEAQIRQVILKGKPGTAMRGYPMKDEQLNHLMQYLRSLPRSQ